MNGFNIRLQDEDATQLWQSFGDVLIEQSLKQLNAEEDFGPDAVFLDVPPDATITIEGKIRTLGTPRWRVPTTFYDFEGGVVCKLGTKPHIFNFGPDEDFPQVRAAIQARNKAAGLVLPDDLRKASAQDAKHSPREFEQSVCIARGSNFPGDRDLHRGLMLKSKHGIWDTNENEGTKFYNGAQCVTQYKPPEIFPEWWHDTREATLKQLDNRFREMRSELTADVIDILFHHWYQHRNPKRQDKAAITLSQLCAYRGKQPQKKTLAALWQAMRDARSFRLMGDGIDAALFEMDSARAPQSNLFGLEDPPRADVAYFYSPGFFLAQAIKENPIYIAPYVRKVWELDPYRDAIAKRLSRYLRGEWRMNTQRYLRAKDQDPIRYHTWQSILDAAGVDVDEYLNSPNPIRLKQDVETALNTLYDNEAIAECGATIYHRADRAILDNLPRNGAMRKWLELRVCIDPPADVSDALEKPNAKRIARTIEAQAAPDAKKARTKRAKAAE